MEKRHVVRLNDDQRTDLEHRVAGRLTLRERNRVQVLLRADAGQTDADIAVALDLAPNTVANIRRRFATAGLDAALTDKPWYGGPAKLDGKAQAMVVALACSPAPEGRTIWTAKLLAHRLVELQMVATVSEDTILRVVKKATSSPGRRKAGACPKG
jgi:transposase